MTSPLVLDDLFNIPEETHAGDWVTVIGRDTEADVQARIREYVVTPQLAECFDRALSIVKTALANGVSQASYLDGSFGAGKSHFLTVLRAVLNGVPQARGLAGLAGTVAGHDSWLRGKRFFQVDYHMIDAVSLESAILGGYVDAVRRRHPDKPLPAVHRDGKLLDDARVMRRRIGDDAFMAGLSEEDSSAAGDSIHDEWAESAWSSERLDTAFAAPPGDPEREALVSALIGSGGHFASYHDAVRATAEGFIDLDHGLGVISRHAKEILGYDAIVLLLDETVLWLSKYISDTAKLRTEAQKLSKLYESAETDRPAPIISFVPRQRDLSELVGKGVTGADHESLFDTLKYWDGRFESIRLADQNLPTVVRQRLLEPKGPQAVRELDEAFARTAAGRAEIWDALLDAQGEPSTREQFRESYPFSPVFLHIMVDVSSALQRTRSALKLMSELLMTYRSRLKLGRLMPVGAIFQILADSTDRPFTDRLRDEFEKTKSFYANRLRPYLLHKHRLTEADLETGTAPAAFEAEDLMVKTLLLSALVPIPALQGLTATRLHALNLGAVTSMIPGAEVRTIAQSLRDLGTQFGDFQVSDDADPRVDVHLIGVDTQKIIQSAHKYDTAADRQRLLRRILWKELGITEDEATAVRTITWRGTERTVEVVYTNVREQPEATFAPDRPQALRMFLDYPFDEGTYGPTEDRLRVVKARELFPTPPLTLAWLPAFFSLDRLDDLGYLVVIESLLERDRLDEFTANLTADERAHARAQLRSRRDSLFNRITEVLRQAYGVAATLDGDVNEHPGEHFVAVDQSAHLGKPSAGTPLEDAFTRMCRRLLDHTYPTHPDLDKDGRGPVRRAGLQAVLVAVGRAAQLPDRRLELAKTEFLQLRRIAEPLEIATVPENFVLRDEWRLRLDKRAAAEGPVDADVTVHRLRQWIDSEIPGLPSEVVDLLVHTYAHLADRTWVRAEQEIAPPSLTGLAGDMVLRKQAMPERSAFDRAAQRAGEIFGAERRSAYTSRAAAAIFRAVHTKAEKALTQIENLRDELDRHAATLGLAADSPRRSTVEALWTVLNDLLPHSKPTPMLTALAEAELPKDSAIYKVAMEAAENLAKALASANWDILDGLAATVGAGGVEAEKARLLLNRLRTAAEREEHEQPLAVVLGEVFREAARLFATAVGKSTPPPPPPVMTKPPEPNTVRKQVLGRDAGNALGELAAALAAAPGARFEITWRKLS